MDKFNLWTIIHYDNKNQEIVSNEFILDFGSTMGQILTLIGNDNVLCYPHLCDPLKHKIKKESIDTQEFKNLKHGLTTLENLRSQKCL